MRSTRSILSPGFQWFADISDMTWLVEHDLSLPSASHGHSPCVPVSKFPCLIRTPVIYLVFFFFNVLPSYGLPFSSLSLTNIYLCVSGLSWSIRIYRCGAWTLRLWHTAWLFCSMWDLSGTISQSRSFSLVASGNLLTQLLSL